MSAYVTCQVFGAVVDGAMGAWRPRALDEVQNDIEVECVCTGVGGVISPLLANVYLHEVLDKWFVQVVRPRLRGRAELIRYADDAVVVCACEDDASRVMEVLPKRFGKYGLTLHPEKTRVVRFDRPRPGKDGTDDPGRPGQPSGHSFDFLGFTHYWARSRRGTLVVKKRTAKGRLSRALRRINEWCRDNRHQALSEQSRQLGLKLKGHYGYYGVTGNWESLESFYREALSRWRRWLSRRSQRGYVTWESFRRLLARYALPKPRITRRANPLTANP